MSEGIAYFLSERHCQLVLPWIIAVLTDPQAG
jgi:hypothetical protein